MTFKDFEALVERRFAACRKILGLKNKEYASDADKLSNFKQAAALKGETPERALWGMWAKHIISVRKIVEDIDAGVIPGAELIAEKFGDMINYTLLLEGLILDRKARETVMAGMALESWVKGEIVPFPFHPPDHCKEAC